MKYDASWDLSTIPDEELKRERARRNSARRTPEQRKGGRPALLKDEWGHLLAKTSRGIERVAAETYPVDTVFLRLAPCTPNVY